MARTMAAARYAKLSVLPSVLADVPGGGEDRRSGVATPSLARGAAAARISRDLHPVNRGEAGLKPRQGGF